MRSTILEVSLPTALLTLGAPFAYGETAQVTVAENRFDGAVSASSVTVLELKDIERLAVSNVADAFRKLPQFFTGAESENSAGGTAAPNATFSLANSVDLRGLGSSSTLVLINGRRVAPSDFGGYVDLSLIPISATQRIEVMMDGASAIYGADAVAGVVNIVLRENFDGAESRARA